jgi:hypothetical protein
MRSLWKSSLALSLGFLAAQASAEDPVEPAVVIGRPIAATIGRPIPATTVDPELRPASMTESNGPIIRAAAPDVAIDRPVATSRPMDGINQTMFSWRRPDEAAPLPAGPGAVAPPPGGVTVVAAPPGQVPVVGNGTVDGACGGCDNGCCGPLGCRGGLLGLGIMDWCAWSSFFDRHLAWGGGCDGNICGNDCYPGNRWYVKGEYLLWSVRGAGTPPLLTTTGTAPAAGLPFNIGSLADPNARIVFGDHELGSGARSGGRFQIGYWFTDDHLVGLEGSFFWLGDKNSSFTFSSDGAGSPALFRPIIDETGVPNTEVVSFPGVLSGTFTVQNRTEFWGGDLNLRTNLICSPCGFLDAIVGFRYLVLDESLSMSESLTGIGPATGFTFLGNDNFTTRNRFYGGQLGLAGEIRRGNWSLGFDAKLGIGATQETADVSGFSNATIVAANGARSFQTFPAGLLTQDSNIGHHSQNVFSVAPEFGVNIGYQVTPHCRAFVGYNFLYLSDVLRPGDQIDLEVNRNKNPLLAGAGGGSTTAPNVPAFRFNSSDFWAQGLTLGLEFRW